MQAVGTGVVTGTKAVGSGQFAKIILSLIQVEKNRNGGCMWTLSILVTEPLRLDLTFMGLS